MTSDEPAEAPAPAPAAARRRRFDRSVLRRPDHAVLVASALYLLGMCLPWFRTEAFDLGSGYRLPAVSVNGFDSTTLTCAAVLVVLAAAWAVLPALAELPVPFPRSALTAGLAAAAFVLTLVEWLSTLDIGFSVVGMGTFLASVAVLAAAGWALLGELRAEVT